jgi:hypothetical protein
MVGTFSVHSKHCLKKTGPQEPKRKLQKIKKKIHGCTERPGSSQNVNMPV